ncbi:MULTISPECIES: aldehyde dehydrogenase [Agrobacterium]|jgi:aldehyde dehydrogenase|uniref:Aldehyde dehydrogenase n=1 Tax=Agrobacterium salinitolerans TaxID=1183413 RepID=A0A9X3KRC5_9HYPH|nr:MULTISPECIES: aldehyde dehydrogenase [Agrobacterium]MBA4775741.1 aldehyde dehydrogenase [Hyphomicrobiales bacterium]MCZ7851388.1 aldehyde dehydrogenase [Agrobacterium salinitolerans]MCZ7856868.1 aldehyde dehydrogenase [Agrobacterium salinitolerans]MCZ7863080.1 aldehyde dehydrogenase [Agrobacterium salinitolerans]MCZ7886124.1 aldehyde dehydrogenase [Agrobacterium salinitolerans]
MNIQVQQKAGEAPFKLKYGNYIGGKWVEPKSGRYMDNLSPVTGHKICEVPRSDASDIEFALDAAHKARDKWGKTSITERSNILLKIAQRIEDNLDLIARAETWDNGKPLRETTNADIPLAIDHFRYFAGCIRAQEGTIGEIDNDTVAYHFHEPLGVVGQIIPWNFPILMAAWKLAPALAAGNCVVLKPAEQTPASILIVMELIEDLLPPGVLNIVNGTGLEAGKPLAQSNRIAKIAFTGSTSVGKEIMRYAADNVTNITLELGGKSPNIFFADVMNEDDAFLDKALEGFAFFALNQGEVCTCPSRALVHESIYDRFMEKAIKRVQAISQDDPLNPSTMLGAQASQEQFDKIMSYLEIGKKEGAKVLTGGDRKTLTGDLKDGYYIQPTVFEGNNKMRIFQEEIFGPVVSVTTFKTVEEALEIANDTVYGLGAGVWSRDTNIAYRAGRGIEAGRVWTNCYHVYPAGAAFGGYKQSGIGRETHKMMLDHYQQTKNLLVSYSPNKVGFF